MTKFFLPALMAAALAAGYLQAADSPETAPAAPAGTTIDAGGHLLVAMGALASAAQLLMTRAYAQAPAAQIGPFVYTIVVFAGVIGWTLWDEVPDGFSLLGTVLVCLAGALTIRRAGRLAPLPEVPKA